MIGGYAFRAVWLASKVSRYLSILCLWYGPLSAEECRRGDVATVTADSWHSSTDVLDQRCPSDDMPATAIAYRQQRPHLLFCASMSVPVLSRSQRTYTYYPFCHLFSVNVTSQSSVLWHCWLGVRKSIRPVNIKWWGVDVVICLEQGADCLHMVQLMPLPSKNPIISCLI